MGFGGGIWHAGHAWGYQYGGPTSTPNPIPSRIRAGESIPTPYREGRREDGMGRGRGRRGRRTVDPPTPMGQKGVRWCGGGAGVSTVSRPVGIVVGRTRGAFPPRITCSPKPRTGGPRPLDWATWNGVGEKVGEADRDGGRANGGGAPASSQAPSSSPPSSSSPSSSPSTKAVKAPPTIWGIGGGATGDHRGKEESLCKGDSTGRGEVRGRD